MQTQPVNSKGKILRNVVPVRPSDERPGDSGGLAHQFSGRRHRRPLRIMRLDAQFATHTLAARAHRARKEKRNNSKEPRCFFREHLYPSIEIRAASRSPVHLLLCKTLRTAI